MKFAAWYRKRGFSFVVKRGGSLIKRYGFSSRKSIQRISHLVETLSAHGCSPTFFVPAVVVKRHRSFIQELQECGCEIGVHGFQHVDLRSYPPEEGNRQLQRAMGLLRRNGIKTSGFRCPYLSASNELLQSLTPQTFHYSSNKAIEWGDGRESSESADLLFSKVRTFYQPSKSLEELYLPFKRDGLVEIPVCVPDDLQMADGLAYSQDQIASAWKEILTQTHARGELFNLMFHPELADRCEAPLVYILQTAAKLQGKVWVTRLKEISGWWEEKEDFKVNIWRYENGVGMKFDCSGRATLLARGIDMGGQTIPWDETYLRFQAHQLDLSTSVVPCIGLADDLPPWVETNLKGMGYIVARGKDASACGVYLTQGMCQDLSNPVLLVEFLEQQTVPLIRFWPWPDGARSALCVTGDLDAVSLADYASRLLPF